MSAPAGQPLIPSSAMADPSATRFPVNILGQGSTLVVLHEAREYFSLGYDVRDPATSERADVGAVPVPSFASGEGSFAKVEEDIDAAKKALADEKASGTAKSEDTVKGMNGHLNGGPKDSDDDGNTGNGTGISA